MSSPIHKVAPPVMPDPPAGTTRLAILQTRCLCQRFIEIPVEKVSKAVEVPLIPFKGQEGGEPEKRMFYLVGETDLPTSDEPNAPTVPTLIYREGPPRESSRIVVPNTPLPKKLIH